MATKLDICNEALDFCGADIIADLTDQNVRAQACSRSYPLALGEILEAHPWPFAKKQVALVAATAPDFDWNYAYTLPADYLTMIKLNGILFEGQPSGWFEIQSGLLMTDESAANVQYIGNAPDETLFPPLFVIALARLLASKICTPLRQDGASLMGGLVAQYKLDLSAARMKTANENRLPWRDPAYDSQFVRSRWYQRRAP